MNHQRQRGRLRLLSWQVLLILGVLLIALLLIGLMLRESSRIAEEANRIREMANGLPDGKDKVSLIKDADAFEADNKGKLWALIVQSLGGIVVAVGGYFAWRNLLVAQESQITNRFTQAIGQLGAELKDGKPNLEVRVGGIYALRRVARDSPRDHAAVLEVLAAYVRQNAAGPPIRNASISPWRAERKGTGPPGAARQFRPRVDVEAALAVLVLLEKTWDRPPLSQLDLHGTDLRGADLSFAQLNRANFQYARLDEAAFTGAHLNGADFTHAQLKMAALGQAQLEQAGFEDANLDGANLGLADLKGALLTRATLRNTGLLNADLDGADLGSAVMEDTIVEVDQLRRARCITPEQVANTIDASGGRNMWWGDAAVEGD